MKKNGRRILSVILTAVMVFALLPVFGKPMVVKAEDPQEHVHENQDTNGSLHSGWTKISTWTELKSLGENGGNGYLVNDIKISGIFIINSDKTVNLCLNGCSVIQTADNTDTITVYGTLNLYDKKDNSGEITHANGKNGGGVFNNRGTFTMDGGTIAGNNADYGGGVFNYGTFTMNGGTISGNNATKEGGGVDNYGTFTMTGGTIEGNKTEYGGGVLNYGTFTMTEGTITDNIASDKGSGVYSSKPFVKEGGVIDGSIESYRGVFCTVTFNANDESGKTIIQYVLPNVKTNLEPNKFTYVNDRFACWNTNADGNGDSYQDNAEIKIDKDLVLYTKFVNKISYEVTFKVNNGSWSDGTNNTKTVTIWRYEDEDKTLILKDTDIPSLGNPNTGYKTGKWETDPDTDHTVTSNITYTYNFEPIGYTIKFDANGGVGTMDNQSRAYDDKTPLTTNAFTLEGYTFKGWNTAADGSGTSYADENDSNLSSIDGETVTLFAQWQANKYTVKFDSNGGDGRMEDQGRTYDDKAPLTTNTFTFEGKTFNGWNTVADGSGTSYADEEVNNLSSTEGDTVTLYAQWTTNTYTVSWKNHDGTVLETDTDVAYGSTPSYDGETPKRDDAGNIKYTFSGWTPAIDIVKGAATYTATYSENEIIYTVTFDANGGKTDTTTGTTNAEFKLSSLPTPTYEGYTFKGWFTEATGGSEISADTVYTQDTTIYAQWEKVEESEEPKEPEEPTVPEEPQEPTEPETPEITEPEPEVEIPEKDWLDDLRLKLQIANELGGPQTVEYSGDFALPYEIMNFLVEHPDIAFVYHVTYEGQEYTITIPAGKAVAYADTPWYGPLWLLANYGGNNAPTGAKGNGTYIVKAGDTLTGISVKLGVTIQYLVDKNGIKNADYIIEGQKINY